MFDSLIKAIQGSVVPSVVELRGSSYTSKELQLPPSEPSIRPLTTSTLTGLRDWLVDANQLPTIQDTIGEGFCIHVESPTFVKIVSEWDMKARSRHVLMEADCSSIIGNYYKFGQWLDQERFIIELQSKFLDEGDRARVLEYVGNISKDNSIQTQDDGVSQSTTVKKALGRVGHEEFQNPVSLAPWRTFHECEQPYSEFVLRMREGRDGVELALFDSEAGRWKLEAIQFIKQWFEQNLDLEDLDISVIA